MKYVVIGMNYLVERDTTEEVSPGGIHIPEASRPRNTWGTIVKAGNGSYTEVGILILPRLATGDRVMLQRHAGADVDLNGKTYSLVNEGEVMVAEKNCGVTYYDDMR